MASRFICAWLAGITFDVTTEINSTAIYFKCLTFAGKSFRAAASAAWNILRKEDETMTYTKPEITVLGNASRLIEGSGKGTNAGDPSGSSFLPPAYELDE